MSGADGIIRQALVRVVVVIHAKQAADARLGFVEDAIPYPRKQTFLAMTERQRTGIIATVDDHGMIVPGLGGGAERAAARLVSLHGGKRIIRVGGQASYFHRA